jgi:hypothetical protein
VLSRSKHTYKHGPLDIPEVGYKHGPLCIPEVGYKHGSLDIPNVGYKHGPLDIPEVGYKHGPLDIPEVGYKHGPLSIPEVGSGDQTKYTRGRIRYLRGVNIPFKPVTPPVSRISRSDRGSNPQSKSVHLRTT